MGLFTSLFGSSKTPGTTMNTIELPKELRSLLGDIRRGQTAALFGPQGITKEDTGALAKGIVQREEARKTRERERELGFVQGQAQGQGRSLNRLFAQRGLQNSSIATNAFTNLQQAQRDREREIASRPLDLQDEGLLRRQFKMQNLGLLNQTAGVKSAEPTTIVGQQQQRRGLLNQVAGPAMAAASLFAACWVARVIFGETNPKWLDARHYVLNIAPRWFRNLYLKYGEAFSHVVKRNNWLKLTLTPLFEYFAWRGKINRLESLKPSYLGV